MGRIAKELKPLAVAKLNKPGMHFVGGVTGLALRISSTGSRSWILRATVGNKRRDMGLGRYPEISLAKAKELTVEQRLKIRDGIDPILARQNAQAALKAEQASFISFEEAAQQYINAHRAGWKNAKHASQWSNTLKAYAYPVLSGLHVKDVTVDHILQVIEPIWQTKTETANRVRNRIELVLDWAKARGSRTGDNPARWKGNLDALLPAPSRVSKVSHHKAMDWRDVSAFMQELKQQDSVGAKALMLTILTATRSGEVRKATWDEIDLEQAVWTIPAERMKAGKEQRIPLSPEAVAILRKQPHIADIPYIFSNKVGKPLSDMALTQLLRRMELDCTVHGFRSTFRDWAGETTAFPREVIEHALAHKLKDKAEAAYARGDLFTKRRKLMAAWADFLKQTQTEQSRVVPINKKEEQHG
ncbi:MAG: tyrosine-type recombinase/integrase [Alphaproteobacteria bacterium]